MANDRYMTLCRLYRDAEDKVEYVAALIDQLRTAETALQATIGPRVARVQAILDHLKDAPTLLTRNRYRLTVKDRWPAWPPGDVRIGCELQVNDEPPNSLNLLGDTFDDLLLDLGMRPTNPEATEYESVPMSETTEGARWSPGQQELHEMREAALRRQAADEQRS